MKKEEGIAYKWLIIILVILLIIGCGICYLVKEQIDVENGENIKTDLLLIQGKIKQIYIDSKIDTNTRVTRKKNNWTWSRETWGYFTKSRY